MTKQQAISFQILSLVANGMNIRAAIDSVLGTGTTSKAIAEVFGR